MVGAKGFANTFHAFDPKPGGRWRFMQPPFHVTVLLAERGGRTFVSMRSLFATAQERAKIVGYGAIEGRQQTLARLAEYPATM